MIPLTLTPEETQVVRARFEAKVTKGPDCWAWTGFTQTPGGRGRMRIKNRIYYAYRVAYVLEHGPLADGLVVCHNCDNPACVRPGHLFAGTQADNVRDMTAKGRRRSNPRSGMDHHAVQVSDDRVEWAVAAYRSGGITQTDVAAVLGVTQTTVSDWVRGRTRTAKGHRIAAQRTKRRAA